MYVSCSGAGRRHGQADIIFSPTPSNLVVVYSLRLSYTTTTNYYYYYYYYYYY